MYAFCESDLEVILDKKQNDPRSDISVCLNEIIGIRSKIDSDLINEYDKLQCQYYKKLIGYAYYIGFKHSHINKKQILIKFKTIRKEAI